MERIENVTLGSGAAPILQNERTKPRVRQMPIDPARVKRAREQERSDAAKSGPEAQRLLELQYISDALECIRVEMAGTAHLLSMPAKQTRLP
jgi:hypothetical protein